MSEPSNEEKQPLESIMDRPRPAGGTMDTSWRDRGFNRDEGSMFAGLPEENKKREEIKVLEPKVVKDDINSKRPAA